MAQEQVKDPLGEIDKIDYDLACIERAEVGWLHAACYRLVKRDNLERSDEALIQGLRAAWPVAKAQARAYLITKKDKVRAAGVVALRAKLEKLEKGL